MAAFEPAAAKPFLFGEDLRNPAASRDAEMEQMRALEQRLRETIEQEAFQRGFAAGRAEAENRRDAALALLAGQVGQAVGQVDGQVDRIEHEALAYFDALARKLAGQALTQQPLAGISAAAREAFRHLRGVPHLVARVHESLVEDVDAALKRMSREHGFEGRIVVLGAVEIAPGDARLEWADGGVIGERHALEGAVDAALARLALHPGVTS